MLYIVGTPIGNLEDLSLRQAKTLASSDVILTEDTRSTGLLLKRIQSSFRLTINSKQRLISYYKEKEFEKLPEIITLLENDANISLISESGMPLISDPGFLLLKNIIKLKIPYTAIPGPTALINGLVLSGFNPNQFLFLGFYPKSPTEGKKLLQKVINIDKTLPNMSYLFYDSPMRVNRTLGLINELIPQAQVCICREMTKKFEEIIIDKVKNLINRHYKGELSVLFNCKNI